MQKLFATLALAILALSAGGQCAAQSPQIPDCEKIGRAAAWIIYIGYSDDESAETIYERARGPKSKDRMFSDLPWDHPKILWMIEEIQAVDVILDDPSESMWRVGQYGRYFSYQCYGDDVEFLPFSEAKPIVDKCMEKHGRRNTSIELCVVSQTKT